MTEPAHTPPALQPWIEDPEAVAARPARPVHLHLGHILLVIAGGIGGTLARYGLGTVLPAPAGWPLPTLLINLCGALLLGLLLENLVRRGPDQGALRIIRLLVGTGCMGAFTTYSSLVLDANVLLSNGRISGAALYLGLSLVGGLAATTAGIWAGALLHRSAGGGPA
ncbi:CrcB family protein [Paenarthrobacter sp. PH39-S1]|uniref:fluoride efflux transporter FluC n=1 Tax=Paenarthrobacter sp. PH39-S1 TaxID=3046204 RepID=UPI0024B9575D|nr:CrcB family protein [Paenarthrobacter sp. PH39-S1]MDJ0355325.1 CrcB family protein [Paenarthrobacter sp. PH39-S1]